MNNPLNSFIVLHRYSTNEQGDPTPIHNSTLAVSIKQINTIGSITRVISRKPVGLNSFDRKEEKVVVTTVGLNGEDGCHLVVESIEEVLKKLKDTNSVVVYNH